MGGMLPETEVARPAGSGQPLPSLPGGFQQPGHFAGVEPPTYGQSNAKPQSQRQRKKSTRDKKASQQSQSQSEGYSPMESSLISDNLDDLTLSGLSQDPFDALSAHGIGASGGFDFKSQ